MIYLFIFKGTYLLGYKIIFTEVFWYPIIFVFILNFLWKKLGTKYLL